MNAEPGEAEVEEETAVQESLLNEEAQKTPAPLRKQPYYRDNWQEYKARFRTIINARHKAPLQKVKECKDLFTVLVAWDATQPKPEVESTCCSKCTDCVSSCFSWLWSWTGLEIGAVKQEFPHCAGCLDLSRDVGRPNAWWCCWFYTAIIAIVLVTVLSESAELSAVVLFFAIFMLVFLCCCCWCGRCCWEIGSGKICLDITGIFTNLFALYSNPRIGAWICMRWRTCCPGMYQKFIDGSPHDHTGSIHPLRVSKYCKVLPVPCSICMANMNYMYLIVDLPSGEVAGVDLAEPEQAMKYLAWMNNSFKKSRIIGSNTSLKLTTVLTTHKHHDHAQGNAKFASGELAAAQRQVVDAHGNPNMQDNSQYAQLVAPANEIVIVGHPLEGVPHANKEMEDGEVIMLGTHTSITAIVTPGHTPFHLAFHVQDVEENATASDHHRLQPSSSRHEPYLGDEGVVRRRGSKRPVPPLFGDQPRREDQYGLEPVHCGSVFTGDHLFVSGIGNLFEGDEYAFLTGADKLRKLPPMTAVFVGHEYTDNLAPWAAWVDPEDEAVADKLDWVLRQRFGWYEPKPTVPSTIGIECRTNPYLRCNDPKIMQRLGCSPEPSGCPSARLELEKLTPEKALRQEAAVLKKLLELKKNTMTTTMMPRLPSAYEEGDKYWATKLAELIVQVGKVWHQLGYYRQYDALFDKLTCREHLRIYGRTRGIKPHLLAEMIEQLVRDMELSPAVTLSTVGNFTRANKGKLSAALGLMDPDVTIRPDDLGHWSQDGELCCQWAAIQAWKQQLQHYRIRRNKTSDQAQTERFLAALEENEPEDPDHRGQEGPASPGSSRVVQDVGAIGDEEVTIHVDDNPVSTQ